MNIVHVKWSIFYPKNADTIHRQDSPPFKMFRLRKHFYIIQEKPCGIGCSLVDNESALLMLITSCYNLQIMLIVNQTSEVINNYRTLLLDFS